MGRECGYTREELEEYTPHQLDELVQEVVNQRRLDWWENAYPLAQLTAVTINMNSGRKLPVSAEDLIGERPGKQGRDT